MNNVIAFQKPATPSISPALRAEAIAWLLREKDAAERRLAGLNIALAEITGQTKRENVG
jgi:hypothetical protein